MSRIDNNKKILGTLTEDRSTLGQAPFKKYIEQRKLNQSPGRIDNPSPSDGGSSIARYQKHAFLSDLFGKSDGPSSKWKEVLEHPVTNIYSLSHTHKDIGKQIKTVNGKEVPTDGVKMFGGSKQVQGRAERLGALGGGLFYDIYTNPGTGDTTLQISYSLAVSAGDGDNGAKFIPVETQVDPAQKDITGKDDKRFKTFMTETVSSRRMQGTFSAEYRFESENEAKNYLNEYLKNLKGKKFDPQDFSRHYNDNGGRRVSGRDIKAQYVARIQNYGTFSFSEGLGLKYNGASSFFKKMLSGLPEVDRFVARGYWEVMFEGGISVQYSSDDIKKTNGEHADQVEDPFDVGALKSVIIGLNGNYDIKASMHLGHYSFVPGFTNGSVSTGGGVILNHSNIPVQTIAIYNHERGLAPIRSKDGKKHQFYDARAHYDPQTTAHIQFAKIAYRTSSDRVIAVKSLARNEQDSLLAAYRDKFSAMNPIQLQEAMEKDGFLPSAKSSSPGHAGWMKRFIRHFNGAVRGKSGEELFLDYMKQSIRDYPMFHKQTYGHQRIYYGSMLKHKYAYMNNKTDYIKKKLDAVRNRFPDMTYHEKAEIYKDVGRKLPGHYYMGFKGEVDLSYKKLGGSMREFTYSSLQSGQSISKSERVYKYSVPHRSADYFQALINSSDPLAKSALQYYNSNHRMRRDKKGAKLDMGWYVQKSTPTRQDALYMERTGHIVDFGKGVYTIKKEDIVEGNTRKTYHNIALSSARELGIDVDKWQQNDISAYADLLSKLNGGAEIFTNARILRLSPGTKFNF